MLFWIFTGLLSACFISTRQIELQVPLTCRPDPVFHSLCPVWNGICRTGPGRPPDTLQHPVPLQHVPDATLVAVFSISKGIIIIQTFRFPATGNPCRSAAHTFPSSITIPCLICLLISLKIMPADKYIMAQLMAPHHSLKNGSNVLCPLRYFIMSEVTCSVQKNITILIFCFQGSFRPQFTDLPKYTPLNDILWQTCKSCSSCQTTKSRLSAAHSNIRTRYFTSLSVLSSNIFCAFARHFSFTVSS